MQRTNLVVKLGVDWKRIISYTLQSGTPVNLTGYSARMQIRSTPISPVKILELTSDNGRITIEPALGRLTLTLSSQDLTEGQGGLDLSSIVAHAELIREPLSIGHLQGHGRIAQYDLDLISPSGEITKIMTGSVCFERSVTR